MPGIDVQYDVNDKTSNDLGDAERVERLKMIDEAWRYYEGRHQAPLKVEPGEKDDNIILNLCQRVIDKTVEFMGVPAKIELPDKDDNSDTVSTEQAKLNEFWKLNDLEAFLEDVEQSGSLAGHVFLKLSNDDETPAVMLLDPRLVTAFWNVSNIKQTLFYRLQWQMGKLLMRQDIVPNWLLAGEQRAADSADQGWTIIEYSKPSNRRLWTEDTRDDEWELSPIIEWKNRKQAHQWYGVSDLRDGKLNDSVNFIASNTGKIIKFHAHPHSFGTGFTAEEVEATSVDGFVSIPNPDAKVYNVEMQSDLASSMNFLNKLENAFFATHRVIDISTIKDKLGQITNFGVRMIFSDMLDMVNSKRATYGKGIAEVSRRALLLMGIAEAQAPKVTWDDPLPINRLEQLQSAEKEAALGTASTETLATELGRNFKIEETKIANEAQKESDRQMTSVLKLNEMGGV